jgi:hypothetical protein
VLTHLSASEGGGGGGEIAINFGNSEVGSGKITNLKIWLDQIKKQSVQNNSSRKSFDPKKTTDACSFASKNAKKVSTLKPIVKQAPRPSNQPQMFYQVC